MADSPATMAVSMKAQVKELLAQGYDQEQILAYFENSYGEFVRLEPPLRGVNWLVWLGPVLALAAGGAFVVWTLRAAAEPGAAWRTIAAARPRHAARRPRARAPRAARPRAGLRMAGRPPTRSVRLMPARRRPVAAGARGAGERPRARGAPGRWLRRRGGPAATAAPGAPSLELRDLDGRVATLLRQLRELDDMAAKRTPEQLARERYALELEAARALQ